MRHSEMTVMILGNFGVTDSSGVFLNAEPGTWYNFFKGGNPVEISDPAASFPLKAGEFYLLTSVPVEPAEEGLITVAMESTDIAPVSESVELASYPNPFSDSTTIELTVARRGRVQLEIFDVLGRVLKTLVDDELAPGKHAINFRADGLPAGVYFLRFSTQAGQKTVPLTRAWSV